MKNSNTDNFNTDNSNSNPNSNPNINKVNTPINYNDLILSNDNESDAIANKTSTNNQSDKDEFDNAFNKVSNELNNNQDLDKALDVVQDDSLNSLSLIVDQNFKDHDKVADRINSHPDLGWQASSYLQFKDKTISQLNRLAGTKRVGSLPPSIPSNVDDLPKNFNKWVQEG